MLIWKTFWPKSLLEGFGTLSHGVLSSDLVAQTRVQVGDLGLIIRQWIRTLANSPLEVLHLVKDSNGCSNWIMRQCLTVTQDSDQDTTAASGSSAWVIWPEQCSAVTITVCKCWSLMSTGPVLCAQRSSNAPPESILQMPNTLLNYL